MQSVRLDKYILDLNPEFSRSRIEGLIKAGFVTVNGVKASKAGMKIVQTDKVEIEIPPPVPAVPEPEDIHLDVIYEDDDIIVINKEPGMVVHPAPGHFTGTLVNALLHRCPNLSGIGGVARPGLVHRLDQDTSGVMIVAKSQRAMDRLVSDFSSHSSLEKIYLAISHEAPTGSPSCGILSGRIENLIGRHKVDRKKMAVVTNNGKRAITNWRVLQGAVSGLTPIECRIETGRTHQIRVHLSSIGRHILGDTVYGKSSLDAKFSPRPPRQMLHARKLVLRHPCTGKLMAFVAPIPKDMMKYLPSLEQLD